MVFMKNVIITGTSRGIGFELAIAFAQAGHNVLGLSRNAEPIKKLGIKSLSAIAFDISKESDFHKLKSYLQEEFNHVDILINNAGFLVHEPFEKLTQDDFRQSYEVNVFGPVALIQEVLPFMNKNGHVVNISSMGGIQGSVKFPGLSAYSSSKGAILTLTELLAEEYKESGPSFNALALGAVQTEMFQEAFPHLKANCSPKEMASYIMEFALNGNQFYNGKILQVSNSTP